MANWEYKVLATSQIWWEVLFPAPSAPVDVRVTRTKSTQFRVSWRHRNLGPGYHNVRRYSVVYGASDGQTRRKSTANRVSYLDVRNVTANTNYSVKVYGQIRRGVRTDDSSSITVTTGNEVKSIINQSGGFLNRIWTAYFPCIHECSFKFYVCG